MTSTNRILRDRHLHALVALDNFDGIAERIRNLLSHGRRITVTDRFTYVDSPPTVTPGLTVDRLDAWASENGKGLTVRLKPGTILTDFGIAAHAGENDTEAQERKRFRAAEGISDDPLKRRRDMIEVDMIGGLPGDGPARDDKLVIRAWNRDGVCRENVVVFDLGPRDGDYRAARWLYANSLGDTHRARLEEDWDLGRVPHADVKLWETRAADLLAAVADERH